MDNLNEKKRALEIKRRSTVTHSVELVLEKVMNLSQRLQNE
jgi:hypothetical protein